MKTSKETRKFKVEISELINSTHIIEIPVEEIEEKIKKYPSEDISWIVEDLTCGHYDGLKIQIPETNKTAQDFEICEDYFDCEFFEEVTDEL